MESSEGTDSFEATFIIVTVVFVVVALILTALAVLCIMCRPIQEQMEGTTGGVTKKSFLDNIYYSACIPKQEEYKDKNLGYRINSDITEPSKYPFLGISECMEYDINNDCHSTYSTTVHANDTYLW